MWPRPRSATATCSRSCAGGAGRWAASSPRSGAGGAARRGSRSFRRFPMCGIVGYVGHRPVQDLLLAGLEKLEYRGYDSAGISMVADGQVESVRAVGNLGALRDAVAV